MKSALIIFLSVLICKISICQIPQAFNEKSSAPYAHAEGDFMAAVSPTVLFNTLNGTQMACGIKMRMFAGKRFSFDTDLMFSANYLHAGMGLAGIPLALLCLGPMQSDESTFKDFLAGIAGIAMSLEHTAYHIPVSRQSDLSPYISLLRFKYSYKPGLYDDPGAVSEQLSFAAGLELNRYYGRFVLAPYCEYCIGYVDGISGINAGIYFGMYFPNKSGYK